MGCNASKVGLNGDGMTTSNYMTYHHKPIHRRDSDNNLGQKTPCTVSSSSLYPAPRRSVQRRDREIQGKREHDRNHGSGRLGFGEMKEGRDPSLGGAPSFKDYLVSNINEEDEEDKKMNESESEEKGRNETPENQSAYASAGEASPILLEDDAIVGEACLLSERSARDKKSTLKGRLYFKGVITMEKLKNMLRSSSMGRNE